MNLAEMLWLVYVDDSMNKYVLTIYVILFHLPRHSVWYDR